jgi:large subunit ribosomal protein L25
MDAISLEATPRDVLGKKVSVLRRSGMTPIHLYGKGIDSRALQTDSVTVNKIVSQVGQNIPLQLKVSDTNEQALVFVREVQRHAVTNQILHIDFYRVDATERLRGEIPVVLTGEAPAVRVHRGILMQTLHTLAVECLPMDTPERIDVDISHLEALDDGIRVSDLATDPAITILTDPEELIVRVNAPRVAEDGAAGQPGDAAGAPAGEAREESD